MTKTKKCSLIIGVIILIIAGLWLWHWLSQRKYQPVLNAHPKVFLTISGKVSPEMTKAGTTLAFDLTYGGFNPQCFKTTNALAGMKEGPGKTVQYLAQPNAQGNYQLKIPLDRYVKGFCDWAPYNMSFKITPKHNKQKSFASALISFNKSNINYLTQNPHSYNVACEKIMTPNSCNFFSLPKGKNATFFFLPSQSQQISFNLLPKGKQ